MGDASRKSASPPPQQTQRLATLVTHGDALPFLGTTRARVGSRLENASPCVTASPSAPPATEAALLALAQAVARLAPDRRDPERFHEDKSEIIHELRRLARGVARVTHGG